jgi:alpha-galactosidase
MPKVAFIGAGSMNFSKKLVSDLLSFPELRDTDFSLMDIDEDRLEITERAAERMIEKVEGDATVTATTDRREALADADYVLNMINVGGTEPFENEIRIPESYGVEQAIGDTIGPGGVFRAQRTIPVMLDIAKDMEEVCPDALLLNYTNPMAMVCWAVQEATDVDVVGLCHSVQHTISAISTYVDLPENELEYWVAGINHVAWVLEIEHEGQNVYPMLLEAMKDPEVYRHDTVRFDVLDRFGAFCTESSHHLSEYVPWFRTDQDVIEEKHANGGVHWMPTASYLEDWLERDQKWSDQDHFSEEELAIERSEEYGSRIIHSIETDTQRRMNINVDNADDYITNLPSQACVEVPCLVDGTGIRPCSVGDLPSQLAAIDRSNIHVQEQGVQAAVEGDLDALHRAIALDPLTSAALSLEEAHQMVEDLIEANERYLPAYS